MKGCLPCVSRLSKASSQVLPHSQVGLGDSMLEGERAKDTHSQEEGGPGMFLSECCFSLPTLHSEMWPILSGEEKNEEKLAGAGSR